MEKFARIESRAAKRKGGKAALEELLPEPKSTRNLMRIKDDRYLSMMSKCVFSAGFVWKVVDNKWPGIEEALWGFDPLKVAKTTDRKLDQLAKDRRLIRNMQKISAIRDNARFMVDVAAESGSFAKFVAKWPEENIVDLWEILKKQGSRLGGMTGALVLRNLGKDTFMITPSVTNALVKAKVVKKSATSKRDLQATQAAFNAWREETGRPLCQLSRILACSVD